MIKADKEYQEGIQELLGNKDELFTDSDLGTEELIAHIINKGNPKERFGVLYSRIVSNIDTPIEEQVFGQRLSLSQAKDLAVHFIVKQEEDDTMIEHGNAMVTEALNHFFLENGDTINGFYKTLSE